MTKWPPKWPPPIHWKAYFLANNDRRWRFSISQCYALIVQPTKYFHLNHLPQINNRKRETNMCSKLSVFVFTFCLTLAQSSAGFPVSHALAFSTVIYCDIGMPYGSNESTLWVVQSRLSINLLKTVIYGHYFGRHFVIYFDIGMPDGSNESTLWVVQFKA